MKNPLMLKKAKSFWQGMLIFFGCISLLLLTPKIGLAKTTYSGLIGGMDLGSGFSLATLGFKLAFEEKQGWEITYARGGFGIGDSYLELERVLALQYRLISEKKSVNLFLGGGVGAANAVSKAKNLTQSVTNYGLVVSTGVDWPLTNHFGFKVGLDSFMLYLPKTPSLTLGIRNLWYLGAMVSF